ncbi:MAG TPA: LuxR C-terminal-related transcriptional regulator [Actinophytocola sp.]|uniref:LuxR C-terminal-related transcriptional regulator n=1 Tax=Actinophytocola sp. TaxID=1872138 RepID=UPI002DB8C54D|nr:LuxR C-terminal-related transcriptional regulator [Actinophytocola sp.]HEU5472648.1 LuxR C-terminal-related transcriptional regulator [Actinophytocola sp.]
MSVARAPGRDNPARGHLQASRIPHAKLAVPAVPPGFVPRPAVRELIVRATEGPLTVVNAPAGYGKTAVLADAAGPDTAWVSVDADDNDPVRFWSAVLLALAGCEAVPPDSPLRTLVPPATPDAPGFLAELVDVLDTLPVPVRLVLDNAQDLVNDGLMHGLATLIRHHPSGLRLVLSTRLNPALPLARVRLQGGLTDIRADDLRFSAADAGRLLQAAGVELDEQRTQALVTHTDGWPAALRWAALSLREADDPDRFLAGFAGDDRSVADYLIDEVLGRLPEDKAELLRLVSICDEVPAALAAELAGRDDAAALLDELERETSLMARVGGSEPAYRMQILLRSYLRADLYRRQPEHAHELHGMATRWFAAHQRIPQALEHAVRSGGEVTTHGLLRRHGLAMVLTGQHLAFRAAYDGLDRDGVDPWLALVSALQHLQVGELAAVVAELDRCRQDWPAVDDPDLALLSRLVEAQLTVASGAWPVAHVHPTPAATELVAWARLDSGWAMLRAGERDAAAQELAEALRLARNDGLRYLVMQALATLGMLRARDGDYSGMRSACAEAVTIAEQHGWQRSPWLAECQLLIAFGCLLHVDTAGGARHAAYALSTASRPTLRSLAQFAEGAAQFDAGHRQAGLAAMRQSRRALAEVALVAELTAVLATFEYEAEILVGLDTEARETLSWARERLPPCAELALMQAWGHGGDLAAIDAGPALLATTPVYAQLLRTALALRSNQRTTARRALGAALTLAEPHVLIRPFAATETSVWRLLVEQAGGFGPAGEFADQVRAVLAPLQAKPIHGTLTSQQRIVLMRLSSSRSLTEIAEELSVSVNTVKTHVRAIYVKLGVNNRRDAVVAAREHGLT